MRSFVFVNPSPLNRDDTYLQAPGKSSLKSLDDSNPDQFCLATLDLFFGSRLNSRMMWSASFRLPPWARSSRIALRMARSTSSAATESGRK